jgi:hypothetical protein
MKIKNGKISTRQKIRGIAFAFVLLFAPQRTKN